MTAEDASRLPPLLASLADLVIEIGPDGCVVGVSPSVSVVIGYGAEAIVGRAGLDFVAPADRLRVLRHYAGLKRHAGTLPPRPIEFRALHQNGLTIWLGGNPAPLPVIDSDMLEHDVPRKPGPSVRHHASGGGATGWVDVLRNIDIYKAREHDLIAARRTAEAEAAAQAEFLANMSHEIRTPLNSIIGFMQVLKRDGSLGPVQLGHVGRVEEAGRNLMSVVNDVLDLSKIESGAIRLNERSFSPAALVRDAVALIRPQAAEKRLPLKVGIGPEAATMVIGDPDRLRQILLNLLANAVKFTARGEVAVSLDARRDGPAMTLDIVIEDSGVGIAADHLPKLFRRFAQADGSIARRFGGTGLGLAISKRLIEAMGGSIEVKSQIEVGSRFAVRVTLKAAEPGPYGRSTLGTPSLVATDIPSRLVSPVGAEGRRGAGELRDRRLLVAEDVAINQKLVEAILAPLGCTVDMVANGAEAVRAVQEHDYALVLMDMQMPGLDGSAASSAIRALGGRFADLPIIALTANVFPEETDRARTAGMNDLVTKPIDAERLIATVLKWAVHRRSAKPEPA